MCIERQNIRYHTKYALSSSFLPIITQNTTLFAWKLWNYSPEMRLKTIASPSKILGPTFIELEVCLEHIFPKFTMKFESFVLSKNSGAISIVKINIEIFCKNDMIKWCSGYLNKETIFTVPYVLRWKDEACIERCSYFIKVKAICLATITLNGVE